MDTDKPVIGFRIDIVIEPDDDGYHVYCPALKGLHSSGKTEEEAIQNIKYAAIAYLESSIKHNDPISIGIIVEKGIPHHTEELHVACSI